MNRIRKYNGVYQVLLTPHQQYNPSFEFIMGSWTDENMMGFSVEDLRDRESAVCAASDHPDINWHQLIEYHRDNYQLLKQLVADTLNHIKMAVNFDSHLMSPPEAKDTMFDRVMQGQSAQDDSGNSFRLIYDFNDIISFTITNPWTANLLELQNHITNNQRLRIFDTIEKNNVMHLIGRTDIGTTYEILLVTDVMNNWLKWRRLNRTASRATIIANLKNAIKAQQTLDSSYKIR